MVFFFREGLSYWYGSSSGGFGRDRLLLALKLGSGCFLGLFLREHAMH